MFENFFCVSPVCSPARASILTGRIPSYHGIHDWIAEGCINDRDGRFSDDGHPDKAIDYLKGIKTYPEVLADNGYRCGLTGKWHLGDHQLPKPGFHDWYCHSFGGGEYYNAPMIRDGEIRREKRYITDAITDEGIDFIESAQSQRRPFYLSVHYTAPHAPWNRENHPRSSFDSYYHGDFGSVPDEDIHPWQVAQLGGAVGERQEALAGYFSAIEEMDRNVGRLIDCLRENAIEENTLVVFTSDNGMNMGHHGIWGKGNATYPLNMYDSSVKVPFIMCGPGCIHQPQPNRSLLSHYDIYPTLLDILSIPNPDEEQLPGNSFRDILAGKPMDKSQSVVVFDEYGGTRMIRTTEHKLIERRDGEQNEFYDLRNDPDERINLLESGCPDDRVVELLAAMSREMDGWFRAYSRPGFSGREKPVTGLGQLSQDSFVGFRRDSKEGSEFYS